MTVDLTAIRAGINELGRRMSSCTCCPSASGPDEYTPPRCMWFEGSDQAAAGVIVVGLNPGRAKESERKYYRRHRTTYKATVQYLQIESGAISYFKQMRQFVAAAFARQVKSQGGSMSIHWTEIAKCELRPEISEVPLDMKRACVDRYLKSELKLLPRDWPIVAAGRVAFEAMAILAGDRAVIGVPHPTGSYGTQFSSLIKDTRGRKNVTRKVSLAIESRSAVWLRS